MWLHSRLQGVSLFLGRSDDIPPRGAADFRTKGRPTFFVLFFCFVLFLSGPRKAAIRHRSPVTSTAYAGLQDDDAALPGSRRKLHRPTNGWVLLGSFNLFRENAFLVLNLLIWLPVLAGRLG